MHELRGFWRRRWPWVLGGAGALFLATRSWTLRQRIIDQANLAEGLDTTPAHLADFEDLMAGPGEDPQTAYAMALSPLSSTCGLVAGGIWRRAGVSDPRLLPPYVVGSAISRLLQIAEDRGALVTPTDGACPKAGDLVGVGLNTPSGHVFTLVDVADDTHFTSIDGGVVDDTGHQCVRRRSRVWMRNPGGVFVDMSPEVGFARTVTYWVDVDKL
jgi:hypothetical protein